MPPFPKEHKRQEKDVVKQKKDVLKQEKDVVKQERMFKNWKERSKTGKDVLK